MGNRRSIGWPTVAVVLGVLSVGTLFGVPRLIEGAYRGESLALFNRVIDPESGLPLSAYLALWHRWVLRMALALSGLAVAATVAYRFRRKLAPWVARSWLSGADLTAGQVLALTLSLGIAGGMAEGAYRVGWHLIENHPSRRFAWEWAWMAPVSSALAAVPTALGLLLLLALARRAGIPAAPPPVLTFGLSALALYGVLQTPPRRLEGYAVVMLTLGGATVLARRAADRRFGTRVWRALAFMLVLLVGTSTVGLLTLPHRLEARRLRALPAPGATSPNIVLVILDTVRAANLSLLGYERPTTPALARLAQAGAVFTQAISPSPWTLPAHASFFTGRWPTEHGAGGGEPLDDRFPTLAEVLSRYGYHTAGFVANYANATEGSGLARGFARYEDFPINWRELLGTSWLAAQISGRLFEGEASRWLMDRKTATENTDDALAWLWSRQSDRPFFVFMNYMDAHSPHASPRAFQTRFPSDEPVILKWREGLSVENMDGTRAAYDAAIAYMDSEVDRLMNGARQAAGGRETVFIVVSDHGEQLGEHGLNDHGNSLYLPLLHVPLVIVGGDVPGGLRVSERVSLVDLPSTVVDLALGRSDPGLGGHSLAALWRGGSSHAWEGSPAFAEVETGAWNRPWEPAYYGRMDAMVTGRWHYIRRADGFEELFDLDQDPTEERNLAERADPTPELAGIRAAVAAWRHSMGG